MQRCLMTCGVRGWQVTRAFTITEKAPTSSDTNILKSQPSCTRNKPRRDVWCHQKSETPSSQMQLLGVTPHIMHVSVMVSISSYLRAILHTDESPTARQVELQKQTKNITNNNLKPLTLLENSYNSRDWHPGVWCHWPWGQDTRGPSRRRWGSRPACGRIQTSARTTSSFRSIAGNPYLFQSSQSRTKEISK